MRFSWRRKVHVSMVVHDAKSARVFIRSSFNNNGEYCGDNPYLAGSSIMSMLMRWHRSGMISDIEYLALLREYKKK